MDFMPGGGGGELLVDVRIVVSAALKGCQFWWQNGRRGSTIIRLSVKEFYKIVGGGGSQGVESSESFISGLCRPRELTCCGCSSYEW